MYNQIAAILLFLQGSIESCAYVCFERTPITYGAANTVIGSFRFYMFTRTSIEHMFAFVNIVFRTNVLLFF